MAEEILDVVNDQNEVIGQATRKEIYEKKLNCRTVHVYLDDEDGKVLIARRGAKVSRPHMFCATIAGHVDAGETYEQAALREAREEVGAEIGELVHIGNCGSDSGHHFCQIYVAKAKSDLKPCVHEVDRLVPMTADEVDYLVNKYRFMFLGSFVNSFERYKEYKNV